MKKWQVAALVGMAVFFLTKKAKASREALVLGPGFESLNSLATTLQAYDPRFDSATLEGRAALALALAIGGTEVYSKGTTATDFFTRRGGTGNNMLGFAQFNLKYHADQTDTPEKYVAYTADMLTGRRPLPNGRYRSNYALQLSSDIVAGLVPPGGLPMWMRSHHFGGSNWQGIDDGWSRVPGLSEELVAYVQYGADAGVS